MHFLPLPASLCVYVLYNRFVLQYPTFLEALVFLEVMQITNHCFVYFTPIHEIHLMLQLLLLFWYCIEFAN